ncbi:MAG: ADP-ribosylglycohydrolase family protein [Gemmatimonadales bacterium]|jgi:ADP-ribosylglycohydrolase
MSETPQTRERFRGLLIGTAVGDALGLPAEGISRRRARRMFRGRWRHRLLFKHGMVSDDTDHAVLVAQCLLAHPRSTEHFARRLAWSLRLWLLSLPAGIGLATLRSIFRLWAGYPPARSGVYSAGNGPAMRAAPLGGFFADSPSQLDDYLSAGTRITHTDPRALTGAKAVAYLAAWSIGDQLRERPGIDDLLAVMRRAATDADREWQESLERLRRAAASGLSVGEFAASLGLGDGVGGYIYHTVPVAVYAWYNHFGDFEATVSAVLDCGGDTDTAGAVAGALAGAALGEGGIPLDWVDGIVDWPRGVTVIRLIADRLAAAGSERRGQRPVRYFWPGLLLRNLFFLIVVLAHGLRRLAPPY